MTKEISPRDDSAVPCECGHHKDYHLIQGCISMVDNWQQTCSCKKFKAKNHSPQTKPLYDGVKKRNPTSLNEDKTEEKEPDADKKYPTRTAASGSETLSDQIRTDGSYQDIHVKEFIKDEGKLLDDLFCGVISWHELLDKRKKLAGKGLL